MKSSTDIILELIKEIHQLCVENKIEYFVTNELALAANGEIDFNEFDIKTGSILMTAENLNKFILCCENGTKENHVIEWMGNNETFPGLFVRYINKETTCYTHNRLIYEKNLGMYITVQLLRPKKRNSIFYRTFEHAYESMIKGKPSRGKKLEPILRKRLANRIKKDGQINAVREIANRLIAKYRCNCNEYWVLDDISAIKYFPSKMFKKKTISYIGDIAVYTASDNKELLKMVYGGAGCRNLKAKINENNIDFFCDTEIPYEEINLKRYSLIIKAIVENENVIKAKLRPYKTEKNKVINNIISLYENKFGGQAHE